MADHDLDRPEGASRLTTREPAYGAPAGWWRFLAEHPPPGVGRLQRWRSPLRGPWLTSVLGALLLVALPIVTMTGLLSWVAYGPQFGQSRPEEVGWLHLPYFEWPTDPAWLYRLNQGVHVIGGLMLIPIVLGKLWSVIPQLFTWPPSRSFAQMLERVSLLMLVGGLLFEIATGVLNIQYDYVFGFSFYTAHYYGAWVFIAGLLVHVAIKLPLMWRSLGSRSFRAEMRTSRAETRPEPPDPDGLVATDPAPATMSRRGALAVIGGGSLLIGALTIGTTVDAIRRTALFHPRGRLRGEGANDFQVNKTAEAAGVSESAAGPGWRLTLTGGEQEVVLDRDQLLGMAQHTATLPIACVEGWSTTQTWTGVRLRDLAELAGVAHPEAAFVESFATAGSFNNAWLQSNQVLDPDSLLALGVNGAELSLDHGYPARVIVPAIPGVHATKWVTSIGFRSA